MCSLAIGEEKDFTDFEELRNYSRRDLNKDIPKLTPDKIVDKLRDFEMMFGPSGTVRRKMLKKWVRTIIENIFPEYFKMFMKMGQDISAKSEMEYEKLFNLSKPWAIAKLNEQSYSKGDKILYELGVDSATRRYLLVRNIDILKLLPKFKECVQDLISVQNRIFKLQDELQKYTGAREEDKAFYAGWSRLVEYFTTVESDPEYSIFEFWGINRKDPGTNMYEHISLSDDENFERVMLEPMENTNKSKD